jgi:hypothetical protein
MANSKTQEPIVSEELDYSKWENAFPNYRMFRLLPQAGGQTVTISPTATQELLFEIPTNVFNLAQSILSFNFSVAANAGYYQSIFADTMPFISQIELYPRSGQYLAQIFDLPNYLKIVNKSETPLAQLVTFDAMNNLSASNLPATMNYRPTVNAGVSNGEINNTETLYVKTSALGGVLAGQIQFPLGMIKNSIFSYNKNLAFNDVIVLRILFGPGNKSGFQSTSNTNLTTGATAISTAITLTNITLYNAVEQDADIIAQMKAKVQGGYSVIIPYINRMKVNAQPPCTTTYRLNASHGITLKRVYTMPFNNVESSNTAIDSDNTNGSKISSFYTALNGARMQEVNLSCLAGDYQDWLFQQSKYYYSSIQGRNMFQYNWHWLEIFDGKKPVLKDYKDRDEDNITSGIVLSNTETRYDFNVLNGVAAPINFYMYALCQKVMSVSANYISCQ